ncbi:hypothetical protein [Micromonospora costi]|uniref:hypothetical protein n=1 Tax=Micromonospora costi TaxID=1530042 RepID=UPI0011C3C853|nr:hypothetical protein [Micromonospora costi]
MPAVTPAALGAVLLLLLVWMWWRNRPPISVIVVALLLGVIIKASDGGLLEDCADAVLNATRIVIDWLTKLFK